jgi:hypothetical protein
MRSMGAGAEVLHSDLASTRIFYLSQVVTARQVILVTHSKPCDRSIIGPGHSALTRPFELSDLTPNIRTFASLPIAMFRGVKQSDIERIDEEETIRKDRKEDEIRNAIGAMMSHRDPSDDLCGHLEIWDTPLLCGRRK